MRSVIRIVQKVVRILTAEWVFNVAANSAGVIVFRSLFTALVLVSVMIGVHSIWTYCPNCVFRYSSLLEGYAQHWESFALIFAGSYTALYSRFSSQWEYLANLYNEQKSASLNVSSFSEEERASYDEWRAGFIVDAIALHLHGKKEFTGYIKDLLEDKVVTEIYEAYEENPSKEKLLNELKRIV